MIVDLCKLKNQTYLKIAFLTSHKTKKHHKMISLIQNSIGS